MTNYKVDRVFVPARAEPAPDAASQAATALLEKRRQHKTSPPAENRSSTSTIPPITSTSAEAEAELSLRRQLSRLQRQLAEAQRELANKDDELALEVEKRMLDQAAYETLAEAHRKLEQRLESLLAYEARTQGIEQRLQESLADYDELAQRCDQERERTAAANAKLDELTRSFDETRTLWSAERAMLEERAAAERAQLQAQRDAALEDGKATVAATTSRLRATHETEIAQIREAHERALASLRGELEPKALETRSLIAEKERLTTELAAAKADAERILAERTTELARERDKLVETQQAELANQQRAATAELARFISDHDQVVLGLQQQLRAAENREQAVEDTVTMLREKQLELQRELAEAKERASQLEVTIGSLEARMQLATNASESMLEEQRSLRAQLDAATSEARRNALDRLRFVSYLEEGLAMLGALPPTTVTIEADEPPAIEPEPAPATDRSPS